MNSICPQINRHAHICPFALNLAPTFLCATCQSQTYWQRVRGIIGLMLVALVSCFVARTAEASQILRIATWDLSSVDASVFARPKTKKPSWRHTFGSERQDRKRPNLGVFNLDVDVVLLQGARNVRALRRIFPPRYWKLIVSRDYMQTASRLSRLPPDLQSFDISTLDHAGGRPVTVVAIRYQRRLRVRAIDYIPIQMTQTNKPTISKATQTATAVRLNYFGSVVWLVSMALPEHCRGPYHTCSAWTEFLSNWSNQADQPRHQHTNPLIAGIAPIAQSNTPKTANTMTDHACGSLVKASQKFHNQLRLGHIQRKTRKKLGCIVIGDVKLLKALPPQQLLPSP